MLDRKNIFALLECGEKADLECKEAAGKLPLSIYETYSAFANTNGGIILLGIQEEKRMDGKTRWQVTGVKDPQKMISSFWNTINNNKVSANILFNECVYVVDMGAGQSVVVIEVPRASYTNKPVYIGDNPFKGTYKRNHEGDYHCSEEEVRAMVRDQNPQGNDGLILEHYTMEDIDRDTLKRYRNRFRVVQADSPWNEYEDQEFLRMLGGYRKDRNQHLEGLTLAGLLMFGKGYPIRDVFDHLLMDYRDETNATMDARWNDRITYDGSWENNLYNFFEKVVAKLSADLPRPFHLEGMQRIDDTPMHKAIREAMTNMIIHADFQMQGTLKVIRKGKILSFTNPGILKLPREQIYEGGHSRARNPRIQTMFRLVGFGDSAGPGFPAILSAWKQQHWPIPDLREDTLLNEVTLVLSMDSPNESKAPKHQSTDATGALELAILRLIRQNPEIRQIDLARQTGVSRRIVQGAIDRLKDTGMIRRVGGKRYGYWQIRQPVGMPDDYRK